MPGSGDEIGAGARAADAGVGGRVCVGRGPREVEALLFAELARHLARAAADPAALARPVRIVVPSKSLAQHVSAQLVRRTGRAVLGVSVRTVHALASELLARAGVALPPGDGSFEILVRRAAREEPDLAALGAFADGHATVAASVSDLLDAGFGSATADALEEAADACAGDAALAARARAVVRVASRVAHALEAGRAGHRSELFRAACEVVERDPEAALPSRAILIHGFADATGVVTNLLLALVERCGALAFLDRPPDPAERSREEPGVRFSDRFSERIAGGPLRAGTAGGREGAAGEGPTADRLEVLHATGAAAEARAVAEALRAALDADPAAAPERLAVVARDLDAHRLALRTQLRRLGVPFSGVGENGPPTPAGRRLGDLLALLRDAERASVDRYLEAVELRVDGGRPGAPARADLRLGLHALGASRVGEAARLATAREGAARDVLLPLRAGLAANEDGGASAPRRRLARALLDAAIGAARELAAALSGMRAEPSQRTLAERVAAFRELVRGPLGWRAGDPGWDELERALEDGALGDPEFEIDAEEFRLLLERQLRDAGRERLGGRGGGVQILSVTEARARSFDALWVVGLARGAFPRTVTEDPLLPDALRFGLRAALPDLPLKRDGHDEERYLFAQLLEASPRVALLASTCDDDGRASEVSPLLERLRLGRADAEPRALPPATAREALGAAHPRPAHEWALLAGLHASEWEFDALLPIAAAEVWRDERSAAPDARELARGRLAVLRELDAPPHRAAGLGPYFGFVGPLRPQGDPRHGALYVTTVERLFACPWQTFLARVLRLEALPEAGAELPGADARLVGVVVHEVLERIVTAVLGRGRASLEEAAARAPVDVRWPSAAELDALVLVCAREALEREGIALAGFERALALSVRPHLEVARASEFGTRGVAVGVVGAEVEGALRIAGSDGAPFELRFVADRVDRAEDALRLTDYKSGRPALGQTSEAGRRNGQLRLVAGGRLLQGAVYAFAAEGLAPRGATGRYLHLAPLEDERTREIAARSDDAELRAAFEGSVRAAAAAWSAGAFFPRLLAPDGRSEGPACRYCDLKEACLRGDSGARRRLREWALAPEAPAPTPAEAAMRALWRPEAGE